jgi:adenylate cyclase
MASEPGRGFLGPRLRRRLLLGLAVAAAATAAALAARATPPLEVAEARSYDLRSRWLEDPASADTSIVIIAIDENTLEVYGHRFGRWPWDRDAYAHLVGYAAAGGAGAIAFDVMFPEPDVRYPEGDTIFADWLEDSGRSVLAFTLSPGDAGEAGEWATNRAADRGAAWVDAVARLLADHAMPVTAGAGHHLVRAAPEFAYAEPPYPLIGQAARALGVVNWTPDPDGVTRGARLVFRHGDRVFPSLPLAAAAVLDPDRYGGPVSASPGGVRLGDTAIPLSDGRLLVRWRGPYMRDYVSAFRVIPAFHVLDSFHAVSTGEGEPHVPLATFDGKAVFIAATAAGAFETRATPLSSHDPGVIIHATILDNLLQGDFLRRASWPANAAMVAAVALVAALLAVAFESALLASLGALLAMVAGAAVSTAALSRGIWLDMAAPVLGGALAFAGAMVGNYLTEGRERRRVRELFGRYVSPEYVRRLADDYENLRLGGERVPVTLLFSDIRGFTTLSEQLPAETVIELLNEYLERMAEVVFRHGGTLDKFIGDAVMAFWNAPLPVPDHPARAVDAALDMIAELERLNERWATAGGKTRLRIGIGINTGEAIVGNIGSLTRKLDYTAIGDTVNLASRLEGLTKDFDASIIVSEATRAALPDGTYDVRPLEEVRVKGKEQAVKIFEIRGRRPARHPVRAGLVPAALAGLVLAMGAAPLAAQQPAQGQARWTDWVYRPGAWQGGRLVEYATRDTRTDSLALVARVDIYAQPPRWRAEFRRVVRPDSMAEPLVLVGDDDRAVVLTALGTTGLNEHAAGQDPVVRAVVTRIRAGRPVPPGPARITETATSGHLALVIQRNPAARAEFSDDLLRTGAVGRLGRSAARLGVHAIGGERRQDVVASAGARGVARVRTLDGEIDVMPDSAAVARIQRMEIGIIELDRFLRAAGIRNLPEESARPEEGA